MRFPSVCYCVIFRYVIVYKKGYQETDSAKGTVTTKVKGIASTLHRTDLPDIYRRVWDTPDYVIPPQVMPLLQDPVLYNPCFVSLLVFQSLQRVVRFPDPYSTFLPVSPVFDNCFR